MIKKTQKTASRSRRPRRTQVERSEAMRAKLSKAAFEVIAERGHSAFRTAAVSARAGVSQGAQVHHFATKDSLTRAALEYAFAQASAASIRRLASIPQGSDPVPYLLDDLREFFLGRHYWVVLDIAMDASKNNNMAGDIRKITSSYRATVYAQWNHALVNFGWAERDAEEIVRLVASMVAGFGIRSMWDDIDVWLDDAVVRIENIIANTWPVPRARLSAARGSGRARTVKAANAVPVSARRRTRSRVSS